MAIMNSHANPLSTLLILSISSRNLDSMVSCQSCRNVLSTWSRGRGRDIEVRLTWWFPHDTLYRVDHA